MGYKAIPNIHLNSVYPHPNFQFICINDPGLRPEIKMGPAMLETEDLVCHGNMAQPGPAVELGPAGSKEKTGTKQWWDKFPKQKWG